MATCKPKPKPRPKPKAGEVMRGRKPGFTMSSEHRVKIQNSNILNALMEHVEGKREMSPTQVTAGVALLKKVLPDLQAVQHSGDADNPIQTVNRIELVAPGGGNG
jgi:hypothetical protein